MSVHKTNDGRWYCRFWQDSRYLKKYFGRGKDAKKRADAYDLEIKSLKKKGLKAISDVEPKEEGLHFDQLAQRYLDDRRNSGWSDYSVSNFKHAMNKYVISFIGKRVCAEMDMSDPVNRKAFIGRSSRRNLSPHSINRYINMTKAIFSWGFKNDLIPFDPWAKYKKPREKPEPPKLLTIDELERVMEFAEPHCKWAIDVAFNTGCRPGRTELFKLKFSDVFDWEKGKLIIRSTKTRPREVDLRPDFLERLKAKRDEARSEFIVDYNGNPLTTIKTSFKMALKKAGIKKKVRPYDLRHMYGTYMAKGGGDIFAIQKLMGHSSLVTTQRYLHHAEELKRGAVNCLPRLENNDGERASNLVPKREDDLDGRV
jgi:integrase